MRKKSGEQEHGIEKITFHALLASLLLANTHPWIKKIIIQNYLLSILHAIVEEVYQITALKSIQE